MLNQGAVEQVLLDYLDDKDHISVEWGKKAESICFINEDKNIQGPDPRVAIGVRSMYICLLQPDIMRLGTKPSNRQ